MTESKPATGGGGHRFDCGDAVGDGDGVRVGIEVGEGVDELVMVTLRVGDTVVEGLVVGVGDASVMVVATNKGK